MLSNAIYHDKGKTIPFNFPAHISTIWVFLFFFFSFWLPFFLPFLCIGVTTQEVYISKPSTSHNRRTGKVWQGEMLQMLAPKVTLIVTKSVRMIACCIAMLMSLVWINPLGIPTRFALSNIEWYDLRPTDIPSPKINNAIINLSCLASISLTHLIISVLLSSFTSVVRNIVVP